MPFSWLWAHVALDYVHGGGAMLASVGLLAIAFVCAAALELAVVGWQASGLRRLLRPGPSARCDLLGAVLLQTPLIGHLGVLMSGGLWLWVLHAGSFGLHPLWPAGRWPWLHAAVVLGAVDLVYYAVHRLMHRWEPLWQLHRFHHAANEATLLTALRVHPLESAICGMSLALPLGLLGGDGGEPLALFLVTQVLALIRHGNLPWTWGPIGRWLLISPAAHRVHHASDPACYDTNFGVMLPWWDRLFGTWREASPAPVAIGVPGDPLVEAGWWTGVWRCYAGFWAALMRPLQNSVWKRKPTLSLDLVDLLPGSGGA